MREYRCTYSYRSGDDGMNYSFPTHRGFCTVEAKDEREASKLAIDHAYEHGEKPVSHVRVVLIAWDEDGKEQRKAAGSVW